MTQGIEETIKGILSDPRLTYPQRLTALAQAAENTPDPVPLSREARWLDVYKRQPRARCCLKQAPPWSMRSLRHL